MRIRNLLLPLLLDACAPKVSPMPSVAPVPDVPTQIIQKTEELARCVYELKNTQPEIIDPKVKPFYHEATLLYSPSEAAKTEPMEKYTVRVQGFAPEADGTTSQEGYLGLEKCLQTTAQPGCSPEYGFQINTHADAIRRSIYSERWNDFRAALLPEEPDAGTPAFQRKFLEDVNKAIGHCEEWKKQP